MSQNKFAGEDYTFDHNNPRPIGKGSYGEVFIGRTDHGREVAVKRAMNQKSIEVSYKEINFLMQFIGQQNIVQLIGFKDDKDPKGQRPRSLTFAMELAECSLDKLMREGSNIRGLPQNVLIDFISDCCSAMKSLRSQNLAHRDIKHMNVLVFRCKQKSRKSTYLFKFCDLGNANTMDDEAGMNSLVGTPNVLHPRLAIELTKPDRRNYRVTDRYTGDECDFWSLACTLHFAACGHYPFPHNGNNYNLYYEAVNQLPKDCIAAAYIFGSVPFRFRNKKLIENLRYPLWFRHAFSCLLRNLLHNPSLESYEKMANALTTCEEYTFLSVTQLDVVKYADISSEELFRKEYPTVKEALELEEHIQCRLISADEDMQILGDDLSRLSTKSPYFVYPCVKQISVPPKNWEMKTKTEVLYGCDRSWDAFEVRAAYLGKGFLALHHADKMCSLFEHSKNIIIQQLKTLRLKVVAEKDSAALPLRFATYASYQYQGQLVSDMREPDMVVQGLETAESNNNNLTNVIETMDQMVRKLDEMLGQVEKLKLEEHELPGMEAELSRYAYCRVLNDPTRSYVEEVNKSTLYCTTLVQRCLDRRSHVANEFCGTTGAPSLQNPLRDTLLQAATRILRFDRDLEKLKREVNDLVEMIEKPFQEMKTRVERTKNSMKLTDKDLRRSVAFHNRPAKVSNASSEINGLVKELSKMLHDLHPK